MSGPGHSREQRFIRIISGEARGVAPALARVALAAVEPVYHAFTAARNSLFDWGWKRAHRLDRPVISVGNLTTGGTGKTPVVAGLARRLVGLGLRPAVLTRGYRRSGAAISDEAEALREALGPGVPVLVDPDRVACACRALATDPGIDVFLMDDGFQHRRLARDFDLVLVDATNPFGFGRVLPRGLLRESISGLRRASAILLTRADLVSAEQVAGCLDRMTRVSPTTPIFRSSHALAELRAVRGATPDKASPALVVSGLANPAAFEDMLRRSGLVLADALRFADHHAYATRDIDTITRAARAGGAAWIVTTTKDWVKLRPLADRLETPIAVAELTLRFHGDDFARLMELIESRVAGTGGA